MLPVRTVHIESSGKWEKYHVKVGEWPRQWGEEFVCFHFLEDNMLRE